jgi:dTDP-4-dehydrorhamnose reductase
VRVLIFGSTGQVGRALAQAEWPKGSMLTSLDRRGADLSRPGELPAIVRQHDPDVVIIAAAYTNVDAAEREEDLATRVNAAGPEAIAREAAILSVPVVHLSTDHVFDGEKNRFYDEDDPTGPVNAYGRSKLKGEIAVRTANPKHLILRTSWVYSASGASFLQTMLRQAESRDEVRVVSDQYGCPTAADDLAQAIVDVVPRIVTANGPWGTYHLAGSSAATRHGFAEAIFERLAARGHRRPLNKPVASADYPSPARRPRSGRLSSDRFARQFGMRLPGYEASLPSVVDAALAGSIATARTASSVRSGLV